MTPFDWADFLTLAERLAKDTSDEAAQRTAISRAYYAAYHAAAIFVRSKGILTIGHTHLTVWRALTDDPDPDRIEVGRRGDWLKRMRANADYARPFQGDVGKTTEEAIAESRVVIESLDRLR